MKILAVDVGRGTQDLLIYETGAEAENWVQMVVPARTVVLADRIAEATRLGRRVVLHGVTMGGGPLSRAARRHLEAGLPLLATPTAAATVSDDPGEVSAMGITLVDDAEARRLADDGKTTALETADVHLPGLRAGLRQLGVSDDFQMAAVAVQDHGAAPPGMSDRRFRFAFFRESLPKTPGLEERSFRAGTVPGRFTRMLGVASSLADMDRLAVMDTGFAALLGACFDPAVSRGRVRMLVNAGNGHTLAALLEERNILALLEHHTGRLDPERFSDYVTRLAGGLVEDDEVFDDGGHGACRGEGPFPGPGGVDVWAITGPRRRNFSSARPGFHQAAPFGSMMQTGCYGLLAAFFARERDLAPLAGPFCPSPSGGPS